MYVLQVCVCVQVTTITTGFAVDSTNITKYSVGAIVFAVISTIIAVLFFWPAAFCSAIGIVFGVQVCACIQSYPASLCFAGKSKCQQW